MCSRFTRAWANIEARGIRWTRVIRSVSYFTALLVPAVRPKKEKNSEKFRGRARVKFQRESFRRHPLFVPSSSLLSANREYYGIFEVDLEERNNLQDIIGESYISVDTLTAKLSHAVLQTDRI